MMLTFIWNEVYVCVVVVWYFWNNERENKVTFGSWQRLQ